jgi:hypothetical protein
MVCVVDLEFPHIGDLEASDECVCSPIMVLGDEFYGFSNDMVC